MEPAIVSDASCLIGLSNIGKIDILSKLYSKVIIPPAVEREYGGHVPFTEVIAPSDNDLVRSLGLFLGAGESEAIALAVELDAAIILDDKKARTVAEGMGLHPVGTVGILLLAKREQLIHSLTQTIDELERNGFYISAGVKQQAIKLAGE
jgi:predicted nucleic acid-binding protein